MTDEAAAAQPVPRPTLLEVLIVTQRRLARGLSTALAEEDATLDEWRVLRALGDGAGHPMGALSQALAVPHPSLTRVVEGLVDAGLVYRRQSTTDRRRVAVHLSRRGRERLDRLDALAAAHDRSVRESSELTDLAALLDVVRAEPRGR